MDPGWDSWWIYQEDSDGTEGGLAPDLARRPRPGKVD